MKGFVYFIGSPDMRWIKIGFATNVKARLRTLNCASPFDLEVFATIPAEPRHERQMHKALRPGIRRRREWFERHFIITEVIDLANAGSTMDELLAWLPPRFEAYQERVAEFYERQDPAPETCQV